MLSKYTIMTMMTLRCSVFVGWMHETGIVLDLGEQIVRLHCCVCAWTWRCYWCSMNALWGRILTHLIRCSNTLQWRWQLTLCRFSFVEWCMPRLLRWSLTNRSYVYILLKLDACYYRSMQYEIATSRSCATSMFIHYNDNDDFALIFVCWLNVLWNGRVLCWP